MSEKSKAYDGDWQGDGCGISWLENDEWKVKTSIDPFWKNLENFSKIPLTNQILMHARSASFPQHKGIIEYNQPYIWKNYSFVFNGFLKGVALPYQLEGKIGAQKIWSLLQKFLKERSPVEALQETVTILNKHTREIQAINLGLSDSKNFYVYSQYNSHPDYYNVRIYKDQYMQIICSEDLPNMNFEKAETKKIILI
jgi:predicted glutamine amidotransferase